MNFEKGKRYKIYYRSKDGYNTIFVNNISECGNYLRVTLNKKKYTVRTWKCDGVSVCDVTRNYHSCCALDIIDEPKPLTDLQRMFGHMLLP